jgi:hypothetical protein
MPDSKPTVATLGRITAEDLERAAFALHRFENFRFGWGPPFDDAGPRFAASERYKEGCRERVRCVLKSIGVEVDA